MGLIEDTDNRRLKLGRILEPLVLAEFNEVTCLKAEPTPFGFIHNDHDFIKGHIDAHLPGLNAGVEIKTASEYFADSWKDKVPDEYMVQVQHYMAVTGFDYFYIAAWIGFSDFVYYRVDRDQDLIDEIIQAEVDFWECYVLPKLPPPVSSQDNSILNKTLKEKKEGIISLPIEFESIIDTLDSIKNHIAYYDEKKGELEAKIKFEIGSHAGIETPNYIVTWKPNKNGIRLLNIREKKNEPRTNKVS